MKTSKYFLTFLLKDTNGSRISAKIDSLLERKTRTLKLRLDWVCLSSYSSVSTTIRMNGKMSQIWLSASYNDSTPVVKKQKSFADVIQTQP